MTRRACLARVDSVDGAVEWRAVWPITDDDKREIVALRDGLKALIS